MDDQKLRETLSKWQTPVLDPGIAEQQRERAGMAFRSLSSLRPEINSFSWRSFACGVCFSLGLVLVFISVPRESFRNAGASSSGAKVARGSLSQLALEIEHVRGQGVESLLLSDDRLDVRFLAPGLVARGQRIELVLEKDGVSHEVVLTLDRPIELEFLGQDRVVIVVGDANALKVKRAGHESPIEASASILDGWGLRLR